MTRANLALSASQHNGARTLQNNDYARRAQKGEQEEYECQKVEELDSENKLGWMCLNIDKYPE